MKVLSRVPDGDCRAEVALARQLYAHVKRLITILAGRVRRWRRLAYERHLLGSLNQHQLRDIGITRDQALRESARPFWDDPGIQLERHDP